MNKIVQFFILGTLSMLGIGSASAQCIPVGPRPVSGTVSAGSGTFTFSNVPTGNVVQINCPAANTQYLIDLCSTNTGTNVLSGTNDGQITVLSANSAAATNLDFLEDGCANVAAPGYGPPVGTWTAPAPGTYFLYLTEWNVLATADCVADGLNTAYDFVITVTAPPTNDLALDSAAFPVIYTSIPLSQINQPFTVGARVRNIGSAAATNVSVNVRIRNLTTNTVVSTQNLSGPASLASGTSAYVAGTNYTPPLSEAAYEFRYISSMTQTDANKTNDTAFRYVLIDSSLMALDYALLFNTLDNVLGVNGEPAILGQKYTFVNPTQIDTVFAYFATTAASIGQQYKAVIYNTTNGIPTTQAAQSPTYTFSAADTPGVLKRFIFSPSFSVVPGTYLIGIHQLSNVNIGLGFTNNNYVGGNALFATSPYTTWTPLETANFRGSFVIWVNAKASCSLQASVSNVVPPSCGSSNGIVNTTVVGGSGNLVFNWSNGASGSQNLNNLSPGTYVLTVTSGACQDTASVTLSNNGTTPQINTSVTASGCGQSNGSATVNIVSGSGNYSYAWSNGQSTATINNVAAGSYTVTVTSGPCTATSIALVSNSNGPQSSATVTPPSCNGGTNGSVNLNITGGTAPYTTTWSSGTAPTSAGTYTYAVQDNNGCISSASVTITQPTAVTASIGSSPVSCYNGNNGSLTATAQGGTGTFTYNWSSGQNTASVNNASPGTYTVTASDANQCTTTVSAVLSNPAQLTLQTTPQNVLCNGGNSGQAVATGSGGTGSLSYNWSNNTSGSTATNLVAGSYTVTLTDANNCTTSASVTVTQPTALSLNVECTETIQGQSTGSATVTATGGTGAYTYNWSSGANSSTAGNLPAGIVNVTVTDANNCTASTNCEVQFSVGLKETETGIRLSLFPNPNNGFFTLQLSLKNATDVHIGLFDLKGAQIMQTTERHISVLQKQFDLSHLSKGVYMMKITSASGSVTRRIVVE